MAFFECEFPTGVAFHSVGGPGFNTTINAGFSGFEQRNKNWAKILGRWEVELQGKPVAYFESVRNFFLAVGGRADAFRFKDHADYSATAAACATITSSTFQLQKTYAVGSRTYVRTVKKPITTSVVKFDGTYCNNSVKVYVGGVLKSLGSDYSIDYTTGIVSFPGGAPGGAVTADFEFHHPVRFDTDECKAEVLESDVAGGKALITWSGVQLLEVRL